MFPYGNKACSRPTVASNHRERAIADRRAHQPFKSSCHISWISRRKQFYVVARKKEPMEFCGVSSYCPKDFDRIWKSFDVRTRGIRITPGHPTVRSPVSSLAKAATGSQTESRGIFQSSVFAFKLAGGRMHAMSLLVPGCEDLINLVV